MNRLMEIYIKAYRWIFPKMSSEVFYECSKDLELVEKLCREDNIMDEKRFTLEEFGLNFIVNDNGRNLTAKQSVDRLNDLNDENKQLKEENEELKQEVLFWKNLAEHRKKGLILNE